MNSKLAFLATTGLVCAFATGEAAAQEVTSGVDISLSGAYDTSPFLDTDDNDSGSVSGVIDVEPRIRFEDETSTLSLNGGLRFAHYPTIDRSNEAARLRLTGLSRLSESTSLNANAFFNTSRAIGIDLLREDPAVLGPDGELPLPPDIDPTLAGQRGRSTSYGIGAGISQALNAVSSLSLGVDTRWREFGNDFGREFVSTNANIGYSRTLSERASLNAGFGIGKTDYEGSDFGDAIALSPSIGAQIRVSETGQLRFSGGATFARTDLGALGKDNSVFASGNVAYCDRAIGGSLCLIAARSAQATGGSGVSAVSSLGFSWSRQFSERDSLSFSARYARSSNSTLLVDDNFVTASTELYGVNAKYRRRFNDRLSAFIQPSYTDTSSSLVDRKPNFGIMAGVTLSLGSNK